MKKLYEKSELRFAIVMIAVYVVGCSLADSISRSIHLSSSISLVWTFCLSLILYSFVRNNHRMEYYGLKIPAYPYKRALYFIPLLLLASVNLWFGVQINESILVTILTIPTMLLTGFLEELLFRGFLFKALEKENVNKAIIISSITFGMGHIVNLINGSGAQLLPNLCQVFYAIAIGFTFVILFYKGKSLLPCILCHGTLNALAIFCNNELANQYIIQISLALGIISIFYACYLDKKL
ncbi:MAG: CPBP family intramembrane metalloprotease [Firmicutes bacterium]|nr:CPBP family intramembrane metalloprotease [Bacillota bacterium]